MNIAKAMTHTVGAVPNECSLLIVEDDKSFLQRLARAMEGRGFVVTTAESVSEGLMQVDKGAPAFAVVDLRLGDGNGLDVPNGQGDLPGDCVQTVEAWDYPQPFDDVTANDMRWMRDAVPEKPCSARPVAPKPTSFLCCWLQTVPLRP